MKKLVNIREWILKFLHVFLYKQQNLRSWNRVHAHGTYSSFIGFPASCWGAFFRVRVFPSFLPTSWTKFVLTSSNLDVEVAKPKTYTKPASHIHSPCNRGPQLGACGRTRVAKQMIVVTFEKFISFPPAKKHLKRKS